MTETGARAQQAPPVQRMRVRYAKRGRSRFTSHRDFSRAFERALRRAGVPMAYSSGYSPHPRISYANAAPTGAATEAEYLEIALAEVCDPVLVRDELDRALPEGLDVLEVSVPPVGAPPLADLLTGSVWLVDLDSGSIDSAGVDRAVGTFLAAESAPVERMTKSGLRHFDARPAVVGLERSPKGLRLVIAHQTPLVRPDDVLAAMFALSPDAKPATAPVLHRLAQGVLDPTTGAVRNPLVG